MKNIKNLWSIICRSSSVDRDSNLMSLSEIIEEITVSSDINSTGVKDKTVIQYPFELVTMWQRTSEINNEIKLDMKVVITSPKGGKTDLGPIFFVFEKGKTGVRVRIKIGGIEFNGFGQYLFAVMLGDGKGGHVKVQEVPLEIKSSIKI